MEKLFLSLVIIFAGLSTGYIVQILNRKRYIRLPLPIEDLRKLLQKTALLFFMPVTVLGAIWIVNIQSISIAALPFIGLGAILLGMGTAFLFSRILAMPRKKSGAFIPCGSFTNIGAIGALICYLFLGEKGFALVPIYKIFEELTYYSVGFPIARCYSDVGTCSDRPMERIVGLFRDPFILTAVSAILAGGILNISDIPRPPVFEKINAVFIPTGTGMLLISIGLAMRFSSVRFYVLECISVSLIKFLIVPVIMTLIAWMIGYGKLDGGLPLKVVIILTSMPVAFNALIPPSIYDLDLDLANACWFFTTSFLVVILPLQQMILSWLN